MDEVTNRSEGAPGLLSVRLDLPGTAPVSCPDCGVPALAAEAVDDMAVFPCGACGARWLFAMGVWHRAG